MGRRSTRSSELAALPLFAACSPGELEAAGSLLTQLDIPAGVRLIGEGLLGHEFFVILDGEAAVTAGLPEDQRVLAVLSHGDFAGEMSLLARAPRSATVTALTPLRIYVASAAEFAGLMELLPTVRSRIVAAAAARQAENNGNGTATITTHAA